MTMHVFGSEFVRHLTQILCAAGWTYHPSETRWKHDASLVEARQHEGATGFAVWLYRPGRQRVLVGNGKRDAARAAAQVAERLMDEALLCARQTAEPA